jgi:hypothetical protein
MTEAKGNGGDARPLETAGVVVPWRTPAARLAYTLAKLAPELPHQSCQSSPVDAGATSRLKRDHPGDHSGIVVKPGRA